MQSIWMEIVVWLCLTVKCHMAGRHIFIYVISNNYILGKIDYISWRITCWMVGAVTCYFILELFVKVDLITQATVWWAIHIPSLLSLVYTCMSIDIIFCFASATRTIPFLKHVQNREHTQWQSAIGNTASREYSCSHQDHICISLWCLRRMRSCSCSQNG